MACHTGNVVEYLATLLEPDNVPSYDIKELFNNEFFRIALYEVLPNTISGMKDTPDRIDLYAYNLLYITFKRVDFSEELYKTFLSTYAQILQLIEFPYYMIVDTFQLKNDNTQRLIGSIKAFSEVNTAMREVHKKWLLCTVIVMSPLVKCVIYTIVSMLKPKPFRPVTFITEFTEFETFLRRCVGISDEIYGGKHDVGDFLL